MKYSDREVEHSALCYTLEDYKSDIRCALLLPGPLKGAAFTAASKRYKQAIVLGILEGIAIEQDLDLTPTMANHIVYGWMGRSVARPVLLKWFATTGRTAANKSQDVEFTHSIIANHKTTVGKELKKAAQTMKGIRDAVIKEYKQQLKQEEEAE